MNPAWQLSATQTFNLGWDQMILLERQCGARVTVINRDLPDSSEQRETLLEAELCTLWIFLLLGKTVGHAAHAHGIQLLYRLLVEHVSPCRLYGTTGGSTSGGESK